MSDRTKPTGPYAYGPFPTPPPEIGLPPLWPGGEPRFPIDFNFYLTALRAELAHLIDRLKAYRDSKAMADVAAIYGHAFGVRRYHAGLLREAGGPSGLVNSIGAVAKIGLEAIVAELQANMCGRSAEEFAGLASDPVVVRDMEAAYGFLPRVRFHLDFDFQPSDPNPEPETP